MSKHADLTPPLGWMGGPCKVVERIEDTVLSPTLREDLSEKVEHGQKLTNPEAAKVYEIEAETGAGLFRQIRISPHAQYRMDQRAITIGDLRSFFMDFSKKFNDWKSQKAWEYDQYLEDLNQGNPIEWIDKRLGDLKVVFATRGPGTVDIVTTFWKGEPDPRPETCGTHPEHLHMARDVEDLSPMRTLVKDTNPSKSDTDKPEGDREKYPTRGLPEPNTRSKPTKGPTVLNMPGESGSNSDGNLHEDRVRTKGTPGEESPIPDSPARIGPVRRPGMTAEFDGLTDPAVFAELVRLAGMYPPAYPVGDAVHRKQRGEAYRYFHKRYQQQRGTIIQKQKKRYNRLKNNGLFKADRKRREKTPERFETKPSGGAMTLEDRAEKAKKKKAFEPIPFYYYSTGQWGTIQEVSPLEEVYFEMGGQRYQADMEPFFDAVVVDAEHLEALEAYLDKVFVYDPEGTPEVGTLGAEDIAFDSWLQGRSVVADFLREQRPPDMSGDTKYDRANDHGERERRYREPLEDVSEYSGDNAGNPGSKVLPNGAGHLQRDAALIQDIQAGCAPSLVSQGRKLAVKLRRVDARNALWLFDVQGSKEPYRIRLQAIRQGNVKALAKSHVRVSCSCPFWQWQGPEHYAQAEDYLYGTPRGTASRPDIKDPEGKHKACKHILAVFAFVTSRNWDLPELRGKQGSLQYLADVLDPEGVSGMIERVAARYIASKEVPAF